MASNGSAVPAPTSVQEVEQLVKRLYAPGNPRTIAQVDDQLKLLQHSPEGWQLADALLGSSDVNVRFFGALTFQVKLNNDGARLDAETAKTVGMRLVYWTVQRDRAGEGMLVRKKLCASLATYFLRSSVRWTKPLLHLAVSFQQGDAVPEERLSASHDAIDQTLPTLTDSQLATLLWLSGSLATEAAKTDSTTPENMQLHTLMEDMVASASKIIRHASKRPDTAQGGKLRAESLACFLNWVNYAQPMWHAQQESLNHLRNLVEDLAPMLTEDSPQSEAMDVFRDILESFTTFFKPQHMQLLANIINQFAAPKMLQLLQDKEPEVIPVAQLIIAYGIANIQQVVEEPENEYGSRNIVRLLLAIFEAPGYPGDDDEVSIHNIEFWNTYIEYVNEAMYSRTTDQPPPTWLEHDKAVCMQLSKLIQNKLVTPPPDIAQGWTDAEADAFKEFRVDASDLMLSIYVRLGNEMLQQFITLALTSLAAKDWQNLEATLFCINTLSDNVLEDATAEQLLIQIFSSSLFRDIADFNQPIPTQTRRTAIDTLGTYGQYIERHAEFLPDTLRFLFASLETFGLFMSAAKSIEALCSTCRNSLTGELDGFLAQYNRFAQGETSEPYTNEKVIGAIAAIVQAVTPESAKVSPLSALLDIVDGNITRAQQLIKRGQMEDAEAYGVSAIECLVRIGKGLQVPDDVPIDLYEDEPPKKNEQSFWRTQEGQAVQHRILGICQTVLLLLPDSGEVVDGVCNVLKAGFTETEPGPFVFPPEMTVSFLEQCTISTPHLESVLSMICTLLVQYSRRDQPRIDAEVARIYKHTVTYIQALGEPSQDPGIAQSCIDVFNRMSTRYINVLLDTTSTGDSVQPILDFALKALDGPDLMPKRSAADFWARMVRPPENATDETVITRAGHVISAYGPALSQALINQITGRAQRSELDQLCEPLKALTTNRAPTKAWLEAALFSESLPPIANGSVGDADKRRFVQQVVGLRGESRRTRDVVKNFYVACRGTVVSY
ncbi:hypothetical protein M409DRAFT_16727 [Zasmidium cellare ATCC 36951]|uniref:Importin N-terminal domain-containing protein n=1 Tax=Zasmidium cellare ATCC 36951 TaxID=1080233 RepID=A0A6A6D3J4_ZASCE|nr:uncharacterized protein M409DRAFT_16727 [Zasmidium cellare ATCC 36951]KAF2172762.1 hypothetical protein M409DRAFT_16727 [Zasmidium cellare ATCC 36951]